MELQLLGGGGNDADVDDAALAVVRIQSFHKVKHGSRRGLDVLTPVASIGKKRENTYIHGTTSVGGRAEGNMGV